MNKKVLVITGVANTWGSRLAARFTDDPAYHVIGIDNRKPDQEIKNLDFIQADIRNPLIPELLRDEAVDTLVHLAFDEHVRPNEGAFESNVMGSIKLFGACSDAGIKHIVWKSSTAIYGARASNPAFLTEEHPIRGSRRYGYIRDLVEIEAFCNGFRRQHPTVNMTILRFPFEIGPTVNSPLTRYLCDPKAPMLLGFDPMMQVIHEQDVLNALTHVTREIHAGVYNVAAEGILPLLRICGLVGKMPIPVVHLLAYWSLDIAGSMAQQYLPIDPDYLRYRWVSDLGRMKTELNFRPQYTAEEAVREFAGLLRTRSFVQDKTALEFDQERLRDTIERRKRARGADLGQAEATTTTSTPRRSRSKKND